MRIRALAMVGFGVLGLSSPASAVTMVATISGGFDDTAEIFGPAICWEAGDCEPDYWKTVRYSYYYEKDAVLTQTVQDYPEQEPYQHEGVSVNRVSGMIGDAVIPLHGASGFIGNADGGDPYYISFGLTDRYYFSLNGSARYYLGDVSLVDAGSSAGTSGSAHDFVIAAPGGSTIYPLYDVAIEISQLNAEAVPEPATWLMMLVGFGAVGGVFRRRRAQVGVAYA